MTQISSGTTGKACCSGGCGCGSQVSIARAGGGGVGVGGGRVSADAAPLTPVVTLRPARPEPVFLKDGFRPFYFGGAAFAALAVPLWLGMWYHGFFTPSLPALLWHMHEMVFGFVVAIIVGFLFTAGRNWTRLPFPSGAHLGLIFGLWVAGRVGMFAAYGPAVAVIDSLLLPVVAVTLAQRFILARNLCSLPLVGVLLTLASANILFHASMHGLTTVPPVVAVEFGLMLVVLVELIVAGRVLPAFTAHAAPGVRQVRSLWLHRGSFALAGLAIVSDALHLAPAWTVAVALLAALAVGVQAIGWNPLASRGKPILWVLHLSYAWIPVGLGLLGLAALGVVPRSAAIHALAVGSMGGLIIGMATRTALGHSGRVVRAGNWETSAYVLVQIAAVSRVAAALIPAVYLVGVSIAGLAWMAAFTIYAVAYAPVLFGASPARRLIPA